QLSHAATLEGIYPGVIPDVGAITPTGTETKIVDVRRSSDLEHQDHLMFGAIKRSHSGIGFVPDAHVLVLAVDVFGGCQDLTQETPVPATVMDGTIVAVLRHQAHRGRQDLGNPVL